MLMLITLLNDGTLIAIGYDNVVPRDSPEKWNLNALFAVSTVLAAVSLFSSLLLLWWSLDSWNPNGVYQKIGIGGISYGQITTSIYLKISVSDFLTLFSARTGPHPFWYTSPSPILLIAGAFALTCSTILACVWPQSSPDGTATEGLAYLQPYALAVYIWIYCVLWWFVQDACKVLYYWLMTRYNWYGWNNTGQLVLPQSTLDFIAENKEKDMNAAKSVGGGHH